MVVTDQHRPLWHGQGAGADDQPAAGIEVLFGAGLPEHERSGVGGVAQGLLNGLVAGFQPADLPAGHARGTTGQQHPVIQQRQHHLPGRPEFGEAPEDAADRLADRLVCRHDHLAVLVIVQPDRQRDLQLALGGLVLQAQGEPGADQVQLGLRHRPLQPQDEPVVEVARMVDTVGVGDQGVGQRTQVKQLIPVGVVAGQPGHLDPQDDPDLPQADIGDQLLEPQPPIRAGTGLAQVSVDGNDLGGVPAQVPGPFGQLVLACQALGVHHHLGLGRLTDVDISVAAQV